jgi:outer membrane receptor for ferrienterochelin and colicin
MNVLKGKMPDKYGEDGANVIDIITKKNKPFEISH